MSLKELLATEWKNVQQLRYLGIDYRPKLCNGCRQCYQVCPIGCWTIDPQTRLAEFHGEEICVACGACVLQCPQEAIALRTNIAAY